MSRLSLIPVFVLVVTGIFASPAYAHIPWFVDGGQHPGASYSIDLITLLIVIGAVLFIAMAWIIHSTGWSFNATAGLKFDKLTRSGAASRITKRHHSMRPIDTF